MQFQFLLFSKFIILSLIFHNVNGACDISACANDLACNGTCEDKPRCVFNVCVECTVATVATDCPPSNACVIYACVSNTCTFISTPCLFPQFCDPTYGCVNCNATTGCNSSFPYCNSTSPPNHCVQCLSTQNCTNGSHCSSTKMCDLGTHSSSHDEAESSSEDKIKDSSSEDKTKDSSSAHKTKDSTTPTSQSNKTTNGFDPAITTIIVAGGVIAATSAGAIFFFINKKKIKKNAISIPLIEATPFNITSIPKQIAVETTGTTTAVTGSNL